MTDTRASVGRIVERLVCTTAALLFVVVLAMCILCTPRSRWRRRVAELAGRVGSRCLLWALGVRVVVRRHDRAHDATIPALYVANHRSWLDILVALAWQPCAFVAKREVQRWPCIGTIGNALGVIWIDRARLRDVRRVVELLEHTLRDGRSVLLFPEGTTGNGGALLAFRSGLYEAARRAHVPVVPIALSAHATSGDLDATCWYGSESLVENVPRVATLSDARITIEIGVPLPAIEHRKVLARRSRQEISTRIHEAGAHAERAHGPRARAGRVSSRFFARLGIGVAACVGGGMALLYLSCPVYREPLTQPFAGAHWYNPYDSTVTTNGTWLDANFHAHSHAWGSASNVAQSAPTVLDAYRRLGYNVIGISDYHVSPSTQPRGVFPVYEHGWNVQKAHRLVLGTTRVSYFDYPLGTGRDGRQHVLDMLQSDAAVVAIAHPALRDGHDAAMLPRLVGYDLLEVFNHFVPPADSEWDAVLSAGHPVWLLADDDSHNIDDPVETGVNRTRLFARDTSVAAIVAALRAGRAFGVHAVDPMAPLRLLGVTMQGDTFTVRASGFIRDVRVLSANGAVRAQSDLGTPCHDTTVALRYVATPQDPYLRVAIAGVGDALLYTNPVVRFNGQTLVRHAAVIDQGRTLRWRLEWATAIAWVAFWSFKTRPRRLRARTLLRTLLRT